MGGEGLGLFAFIQKIAEFFPQMLGGNGGVGIIRIYTKKLEFFPQMLGGNVGPHFCRVRGEGIGFMRWMIHHLIEHGLKRIFRWVRCLRSITRNIFIEVYFFSRFKNL